MSYADDRVVLMNSWNAVCLFFAVWFLAGSFWTASICSAFALISGMLGYGGRWLTRIGFAVSLIALAVLVGAPPPARWSELVAWLPQAIAKAMSFRG